jgi:lysophospholipase L1-like esterase
MPGRPDPAGNTKGRPGPWVPLAVCLLLASLYAVASPAVYSRLTGQARNVVGTLRAPRLSQREAERLRRGYYEDLTAAHDLNSQLADLLTRRPDDQPMLQQTEAARLTSDFYGMELVPSTRIFFRGELYTVNRWGMRDRDYPLERPRGVHRIAVLGSSQTNGWGVGQEEDFESLVEARLNRESGETAAYELLNFSVPGYSTLPQVLVLQEKAFRFGPQAVLLIAHPRDLQVAVLDLATKVRQGVPIPFSDLQGIVRQAGVTPEMTETEIQRRLRPYGEEIMAWAYRGLVHACRERNVLSAWVLLPMQPGKRDWSDEDVERLFRLARDAGFQAREKRDVYAGLDPQSLWVAEWDRHPNRRGHQLLAEALYPILFDLGVIPRKPNTPPAP